MTVIINGTIQLRRGTASSATGFNPVLAMGELGMETDTGLMKKGDGITAWNDLPYWPGKQFNYGMMPINTPYSPDYTIADPSGGTLSAAECLVACTLAKGSPADSGDIFGSPADSTDHFFKNLTPLNSFGSSSVYVITNAYSTVPAFAYQGDNNLYYVSVCSCDNKQRGLSISIGSPSLSYTDTMVNLMINNISPYSNFLSNLLGGNFGLNPPFTLGGNVPDYFQIQALGPILFRNLSNISMSNTMILIGQYANNPPDESQIVPMDCALGLMTNAQANGPVTLKISVRAAGGILQNVWKTLS